MNLKKATSKNIKWSFIESISLKAIGFVLSIILARLLAPSDFGVLAIVNVFYLLTVLFIDGGLKEALIQKKEATEDDYSTMFWLNLGIAFLLYCVLFLSAPFIESFYEYPKLAFYIRLQSLTLLIESFGLIQIVKATKDLDLKKITVARLPATLISFLTGVGLAYSGYGILSLIIQQLINVLLYNLLLIYKIRYAPKFSFSLVSMKSLYNYGLKMLAISFISRLFVQSLNLIFGYYYTPSALGVYTKSRSLQGVPIDVVNSAFTKGLYPTMVKLQSHKRLLKKIFLTNIRRLSYIMIFLNTILFFNSLEIVVFLLGEKWTEMSAFLKIIALGSLLHPIVNQVSNIVKAIGKPELLLKLETFWKISVLATILLLVGNIDFINILLIFVIMNSVMAFVFLYLCSKILKFNFYLESISLLSLFGYHFLIGFFIDEFVSNAVTGLVKIISFISLFMLLSLCYGSVFKKYSIKKNIFN